MYSKEYVRKTLIGHRSRMAGFYRATIIGAAAFLLISILVAPIVHELMHFFVLEFYHCYYEPHIRFTPEYGLYGNLTQFCALSPGKEALVSGAGVLANYAIATVLFMLVPLIYRKGMIIHANFFMYAALGFLSDPLFYFFASEGDMVNILWLLKKEAFAPLLPVLGLLTFSLAMAYVYCHMERFIEDYMRIEQEVKDAEAFIDEIRR